MSGSKRKPGDVLDDRYRLVEELGRGGFGDVWRAEELLPDGMPLREVALKLLVRSVTADWAEEARIIASLRHPALVTVYAAGLLDIEGRQTPFVAMELLEGDTLAVHPERGEKVAWRCALLWARQAAAALDEIHRAGVVHLDLKPANLFATAAGLKVLDFGIARQGADRAAIEDSAGDDGLSTAAFMALDGSGPSGEVSAASAGTESATSRTVVGTPGFMAPEIVEGGEATFAADAYALAACVVQLVTGRLPQEVRPKPAPTERADFEGWLAEVRSATLRGRLRDLDGEGLPLGLHRLLDKWLRLDPVARCAEAGTLRAELDAVWQRPFGVAVAPFRGIAPYRECDEGNFYGRAAEAERLGRELAREPLIVLHGPRGAGLTSLALAGIVPALAQSAAEDRDDWRACHVTLGDDPDENLRLALERHASLAERSSVDEARSPSAPEEEDSPTLGALSRLVELVCVARLGVVLVIEDLAAVLAHPERSARALQALGFVAIRRPGLRVIGLLREEHLGALLATEVGRGLRASVRFVGLPSWSAADELVREPARALGFEVEGADMVVTHVKEELDRAGASLTAIGLALARLWEAKPTLARWKAQGTLVGPLARHAEEFVAAMRPERRRVAEALLLGLVRADGTAVAVERDTLIEASQDEGVARALLDELVAARILAASGSLVMLAHPGLSVGWRRLHDRRLHEIERLSFLEELREAAERWRQLGEARGELWRDEKLAEFERRQREGLGVLRSVERSFVATSLLARRRARWLRGALAVCLVAALAGLFALDAYRRRRVGEQQRALAAAERAAAVEKMVTASRRTTDPYRRIALLGAAIAAGSRDGLLPFELFAATRGVPPARYLTLDPPSRPMFPWDERYLLGYARSHVVILDVRPDEGEGWGTIETRVAAHAEGTYDVEPFAFGHGFVSRGADGTLKVWRLREDRSLALATESPMRCIRGLSRVFVADRAPVVACVTADGLARWDLRRAAEVETEPFGGRLLAISPDGGWLAAATPRRLVFWKPGSRPFETALPDGFSPRIAAFSPREPVVALVDATRVLVFELEGGEARRLLEDVELEHGVSEPSAGRFAAGGTELAVCGGDGQGTFTYLRRGGRATEDGPPPAPEDACALATTPPAVATDAARPPRALTAIRDYGAVVMDAATVGPRRFEGGFGLHDGRVVTRDLVMFDPKDRELAKLTEVGDASVEPKGRSVVAMARWREGVVWQHGSTLRGRSAKGESGFEQEGNLAAVCDDGRVLAWRSEGAQWVLFDPERERVVRRVARKPGFVLGVEPSCRRFFVQWLDGRVASVALDGASEPPVEPVPIEPGGGGYAVDGFVFDVRASEARSGEEAGLWLAFGSGAMARADASGALRSFGHATPRATAMSDGPSPGQLLFGDETGAFVRARGEQDRRIVAAMPDREWSDVRALADGRHAVLSWSEGLALADLERGELVGSTASDHSGRLSPWDRDGSFLSWSYAHIGPPVGELLPLGAELAAMVASRASNLVAEPSDRGMPRVRLR